MTDIQRVKKVCKWLFFTDVAENDKDLADKLGYTKSSFSQILNEKVPLSNKFIDKLCSLDENINKVWVVSGQEEMFKTPIGSGPKDDYALELQKKVIEMLEDEVKRHKEEITRLEKVITKLKKEKTSQEDNLYVAEPKPELNKPTKK